MNMHVHMHVHASHYTMMHHTMILFTTCYTIYTMA